MVCKIKKLQGRVVQQRECSHSSLTTLNGVQATKTLDHYVVHLKLI